MLVCGVDDAGRGPVMGPLVIAGVTIEKRHLRRLSRLGVRDSKELTPARREELYDEIVDVAVDHHVSRIQPRTIDKHVKRHELNLVEAIHMARVISGLMPHTAYVDACDVNAKRFGKMVSSLLKDGCAARVRPYHRADKRFPIVSAASIIAKVERDRAVARIRKIHSIGSGYPADPACVRFLERHAMKNDAPPRFARATWMTVRRIYGLSEPEPRRARGRGHRAQVPLIGARQARRRPLQARR